MQSMGGHWFYLKMIKQEAPHDLSRFFQSQGLFTRGFQRAIIANGTFYPGDSGIVDSCYSRYEKINKNR